MAPIEPKTLEERMLLVEYKQEQQEQEISRIDEKVCEVEEYALETRDMIVQTNGLVTAMPGKIIEMLEEKARSKKLDMRGFIELTAAVIVCAAAVWGMFQ